ncbi:DUF4157 domain-containing protein [Nocardia sp. XZ_19_385]|uniref:eCIS core domain-containing protein n=1 Tax=Nocardia sp. XZ_19_385 TaxID=2769488 RepID=UPI001E4EFEC1|nr:DUF4157 domain-containing protein [Nocardia sp. XZ_19_385]
MKSSKMAPEGQRGKAEKNGSARRARESRSGLLDFAHAAGNQAMGSRLSPAVAESMREAFGHNFSDVTIHTHAAAAASADAMGASAYTVGRDVVFGSGQFEPGTPEGRMLIAHELTHVVQQRDSTAKGGGRNDAAEAEADAAAARVALGGGPVRVAVRAPMGVAKAEKGYFERARAFKDDAFAKAEAAKAAAFARARAVEEQLRAAAQVAKEAVVSTVQQVTPAVVAEKAQAVVQAQTKAVATAKKAMPALKKQAKVQARDAVKGYFGTAEGVWLEAANLIDTGVWAVSKVGQTEDMAFGSLDDAAKHVGLGETQRKVLSTAVRGTAIVVSGGTIGLTGPLTRQLREAAEQAPVDPETGVSIAIDPITKAPMISGLVSKAFDKVEGAVDKSGAFEGAAPDDGMLTAREKAQIAGSVGSQVGLAVVGGEEVAIPLKIVAALGSAKSIEVAVRKGATEEDPTAFVRTRDFWFAIGNMVLFIAGLRAAKGGRKLLPLFIDFAMVALATAQPVLQYAHDLQHAHGPDRDKILHKDLAAVVKAGLDALRQVVAHQMNSQKPGAKSGKAAPTPEPEPAVMVKVGPAEHVGGNKPAPAPTPKPVPQPPDQGGHPFRRPDPPAPEPVTFPPPMPRPVPKPVAPPPSKTPELPPKTPALPPREPGVHPDWRRRKDPSPFHESPVEAPPKRREFERPPDEKMPDPLKKAAPQQDPALVEPVKKTAPQQEPELVDADAPPAVHAAAAEAPSAVHESALPAPALVIAGDSGVTPPPAVPPPVKASAGGRGPTAPDPVRPPSPDMIKTARSASEVTQPGYGKKPELPVTGVMYGPRKPSPRDRRSAIAKSAKGFEPEVEAPFDAAYPGGTSSQLAIMNGAVVKRGTPGAGILDTVVHPLKLSIDAKQYLTTLKKNPDALISAVVRQAKRRIADKHLPPGYQQAVAIDARGLKLTVAEGTYIIDGIVARSGGAIKAQHIWIWSDD